MQTQESDAIQKAPVDVELDKLAQLVAARSALRGLEKVAQTYESNHAARMRRVRAMIIEQRDKVMELAGAQS
jgi:replicative DNA helicase